MLRFHVTVTPSDEVLGLRRELDELRSELQKLRDEFHRVEYRYGCEVRINQQILDYCRQQGIKLPDRFFGRSY